MQGEKTMKNVQNCGDRGRRHREARGSRGISVLEARESAWFWIVELAGHSTGVTKPTLRKPEKRMPPDDGLEQLRPFRRDLLAAVGYPGVTDHVSLCGIADYDPPELFGSTQIWSVRLCEGIDPP